MDPQLVMLLLLFAALGAFILFGTRRQKRAVQATLDLHESLHVGDFVHTTSGLEATIAGITDDTVDLEIAPGVVTTWMKLAIRDRIEPEADEAAEDDAQEEEAAAELTDSDATEEPGRITKD